MSVDVADQFGDGQIIRFVSFVSFVSFVDCDGGGGQAGDRVGSRPVEAAVGPTCAELDCGRGGSGRGVGRHCDGHGRWRVCLGGKGWRGLRVRRWR